MAVLVLPCLLTAAAPPKASINSLEADLDAISKLPHEVVHAGGLSEGVAHDYSLQASLAVLSEPTPRRAKEG